MDEVRVTADRKLKLSIERQLRLTVTRYGKLGLLIDDQRDAESWVARELYAADALPSWWLAVRSMECAAQAVAALRQVLEEALVPVHALCIVDRYLPTVCGAGYVPVAWDHRSSQRNPFPREEELRDALGQAFDALGDPPAKEWERKGLRIVHITSYPYEPPGSGAPKMHWRTRAMEQIHQLRREMQNGHRLRRLLRYGPEEDAPVVAMKSPVPGLMDGAELAEAKWLARSWRPILVALAAGLGQGRSRPPAVLLTGAGAALAQGPHGAGMPATLELLRQACRYARAALDEHAYPQPAESQRRSARCLCGRDAATGATPAPPGGDGGMPLRRGDAKPVKWLIDHIEDGRPLDWRLEELLNRDLHEDCETEFRSFHRALRDVFYEHDYGYPYHYWLLARMGWTAILTTNFDGFHERSAAAAARLPWLGEDEREHCLRLGSLGTPPPAVPEGGAGTAPPRGVAPVQWRPEGSEGSLFKPYGSLYKAGEELAFSTKEIKSRQEAFRAIFRAALAQADGGTLVVIGHAMEDPFIAEIVQESAAVLAKRQIIWLDPSSFRRAAEADIRLNKHRVWDAMIATRRADCEKAITHAKLSPRGLGTARDTPSMFSGPIPAMAHEAVYDLWRILEGQDPST